MNKYEEEVLQLIKKYSGLKSIKSYDFYSLESYNKCKKIITSYNDYILKAQMLQTRDINSHVVVSFVVGDNNTLLINSLKIIITSVMNTTRIPGSFENIIIHSVLLEYLAEFKCEITLAIGDVQNIEFEQKYIGPLRNALRRKHLVIGQKQYNKILKNIAIMYNAKHFDVPSLFFMDLCKTYLETFNNDDMMVRQIETTMVILRDVGEHKFDTWIKERCVESLNKFISNRNETTGTKILYYIINKYNYKQRCDYKYNLIMIAVLELIGIWDEQFS